MSASKVALPYPIHVGNGLPVRRNGTTESRGSAKVAAHEKRASGRPPECNARSYAAAPNDRMSTRIAPGTPFCECKASRPWATSRQPCSSYPLPARWYKVRLNPDTQYGVAFSSTAAAAKSNGKRGMLALYPGRPSGTGTRGCKPASWVTFTRKPLYSNAYVNALRTWTSTKKVLGTVMASGAAMKLIFWLHPKNDTSYAGRFFAIRNVGDLGVPSGFITSH